MNTITVIQLGRVEEIPLGQGRCDVIEGEVFRVTGDSGDLVIERPVNEVE